MNDEDWREFRQDFKTRQAQERKVTVKATDDVTRSLPHDAARRCIMFLQYKIHIELKIFIARNWNVMRTIEIIVRLCIQGQKSRFTWIFMYRLYVQTDLIVENNVNNVCIIDYCICSLKINHEETSSEEIKRKKHREVIIIWIYRRISQCFACIYLCTWIYLLLI